MTSIAPNHPDDTRKFTFRSANGATLSDVRIALIQLKAALIDATAPQIDISCVEIVVAEILNNIVKHALCGKDQGWFEVQCIFVSSGYHFVCQDNGRPMPDGAPPENALPSVERPISELPEGGWGWSLIRALTSNVSYVRVQKINFVSFRIECSPPPLRC